jgi:hypothetical protein
MRNKLKIYEPDVINNQSINSYPLIKETNRKNSRNNHLIEIIDAEEYVDLINYVEWLGFTGEKNILVLSSQHHYYYDAEEIKNTKCVINLKELNLIKDLKSFLHSLFQSLPPKSFFIGCFIDNKKNNGYDLKESSSSAKNKSNSEAVDNGITSRIPLLNMLYSYMDLKTNNYLSIDSIKTMIGVHGFKVVDMTELNGLTYFCAQNLHSADN